MKDKKYYFLFGEDAISTYLTEGIEQLILDRTDEKVNYSTYCHADGYRPSDLLDYFMGWGDYQMISEEEFNSLTETAQ